MIRWIAIGDSFTYLNDHLDETGYRVTKGYLDRVLDKVPGLELFNMGINGSTTEIWHAVNIPKADLYTILLGTNDWHHDVPMGVDSDFADCTAGTVLGNLGCLVRKIRAKAPEARIIMMNPVERGDFVYIGGNGNCATGSYAPKRGIWLRDLSDAIYRCALNNGIEALDLHKESGITPANAVNFKRCWTPEGMKDLPYPEYTQVTYNFKRDGFPYPPEAANFFYDGLHPTDKGNEVIATLLAAKILEGMEA